MVRVERRSVIVVGPAGTEASYPAAGSEAVGDWVLVDDHRCAVQLPRWSALERKDPDSGRPHVLAANVDVVLVTVPADRPNPARAERELVLAWESGAKPVIVLTKADLAPPELGDELADRLPGTDVVATSATDGAGIDAIAAVLSPDRTGVLLGPSGAGKSSLTNALLGEDVQATGTVRAGDRRGRHTTSSRQLLPLPRGGVLIDTPGLRSLGLVAPGGVGQAFADVEELADGCRFSDCAHAGEPGCAVAAAVADRTLPVERLDNFRKLTREAAAERWRHDPVERREAQRTWKQRSADARRNDKRRREG